MTRLSSTSLPWYRGRRSTAFRPPSPAACIHEAVAAALATESHRTLLVDEAGHVTNDKLLDAVQRRARWLLERCGGTGGTVAVNLDFDVELAITYFACLAAGLRYLPLPPNPPAATAALLESLKPRVLITSAGRDPGMGGLDTLHVDAEPAHAPRTPLPTPDPHRIAHVLLTSGTESGAPKAVLTDHVGSMLSHAWRTFLWPPDASRDVVGCNVFGIWDVVPALVNRVPVVMLRDATLRDPLALADAVLRYGITRMMITPTLLDACLACPDAVSGLGRLRHLVLCGEAVTAPLMARVREHLPDVHVGNLYSLSECHDVAAGSLEPDRAISSGRVADFAEVHVVDPDDPHTLMPVGRPGRILVGGQALARGYLDEHITRRRFLETELGCGHGPVRVYDTGDRGRLDRDGTLTVLGRLDGDVKVRGAWADPDAVTARLLAHPAVARAVAVAEPDNRGHVRLQAYVVPAARAPADLASALRAHLAERLPAHSVPGRIELLDELPLLASGKIDMGKLRRGGRAEVPARHAATAGGTGPSTLSIVLETFRTVLDQPEAAATERFEALGGDSLTAIMLCGSIQAATGMPLRVQDLHRHPTAVQVAELLARSARSRGVPAPDEPGPQDENLFGLRRRTPLPGLTSEPRTAPPKALLLSGATGTLGSALLKRLAEESTAHVYALVRADDDAAARRRLAAILPGLEAYPVTALAGDLSRPRLGLTTEGFHRMTRDVDAVVHLGARLDAFADDASLAAPNVAGTRELLELALASGAAFHHLSSSAVLPLGSEETWDESRQGRVLLEALAPRLAYSDAYSRTKLAAEALVWEAAERGLPVTVTRVPHLAGAGVPGRLLETLGTLLELGFLPEGPWRWQLAPVTAVRDHLVRLVRAGPGQPPLHHLTAPPTTDTEIEAALNVRGHYPRRLVLPALSNEIAAAARKSPTGSGRTPSANVAVLNQLMREHGLRAALCLNEPILQSVRPVGADGAHMLVDSLSH